ncbi:hypothetical protein VTI74DRAFT_9458 [Chaetomium olivicolor]
MSGRSAHVRKKVADPKPSDRIASRVRAKSTTSSDNAMIDEYPIGPVPTPRGQRNWHDRPHHVDQNHETGEPYPSRAQRPRNDFAHGPARRPILSAEDVPGIEKSGLRSALDKRSDEVRKGLAKAFNFKRKDNKGDDSGAALDFRCESSATVRPVHGIGVRREDQNGAHEAIISPVVSRRAGQDVSLAWEQPGNRGSRPTSNPEMHSAPMIKRWLGAGRAVQRWNKLRKDPELWDPNGDVLIYLGPKEEAHRMKPSFLLSSHIIEATESRFLIALLRQGSTEDDIHNPPSPAGAASMLQRHGQQQLAPGGLAYGGHPTPPGSEASSRWDTDGQISYEMYFPAPSTMAPLDQLRHHVTTRNVFALLYHASLVGLSLYQALVDLTSRLESYMPPGSDNVGIVLKYLSERGIDDIRNDCETAVSLLAWSERSDVRWEEGWRESFLHCAGMYSQLESCLDFSSVSLITRALLERAFLEAQLRVQAAEERLATFQYNDMWPPAVAITASTSGPVAVAPAKAAMDRLQQFLVQYYTREFGSWPPPMARDPTRAEMEAEDIWLTRTVAQLLQRDFAALYDYLVNRDIVWDESEARSSRKWMMVSSSGNRGFDADTPDLPITDMLIEFDNKNRFPHIPHPYPLVPDSVPPLPGNISNKEGPSGGIFGGTSSKKNARGQGTNGSGRSGAVERRIQLAYTEATNICILDSDFAHSNLVDAFSRFEKEDRIGEIDPSTARRGRWVLIYGILQTLATVSVDAPTVRYSEGVSYHLSFRLKGVKLPPWKTTVPRPNVYEAAHELSHCWNVPSTWYITGDGPNTVAENSADEGVSPTDYGYSGQDYGFPMLMSRGTGTQRIRGSTRSSTSSRGPSVVGAAGDAYTPYSSANSVRSYSRSDTGSSVRSSVLGTGTSAANRREQRLAKKRLKVPAVEEDERASPHVSRHGEVDAPSPAQTHAFAHSQGVGGLPEVDDWLDEEVDVDRESFIMSYGGPARKERVSGECGAGHGFGRPVTDRSGYGVDGVGPMIRDFDELGVID